MGSMDILTGMGQMEGTDQGTDHGTEFIGTNGMELIRMKLFTRLVFSYKYTFFWLYLHFFIRTSKSYLRLIQFLGNCLLMVYWWGGGGHHTEHIFPHNTKYGKNKRVRVRHIDIGY